MQGWEKRTDPPDEAPATQRKYSICDVRAKSQPPPRVGSVHRAAPAHIRRSGPRLLLLRPVPLVLRRRIKHIKVLLPVRPNFEDTRHVAAPVAIIRCGPDGRQLVAV